jgi:hypothetical protein
VIDVIAFSSQTLKFELRVHFLLMCPSPKKGAKKKKQRKKETTKTTSANFMGHPSD